MIARDIGALLAATCVSAIVTSCASVPPACASGATKRAQAASGTGAFPLCLVDDAPLSGHATRFDYEDIDATNGHLVVAHMGDSMVTIVSLADGAVVADVPNIDTVRGVLAAPAVNRIFASASGSDELVVIDATTLKEIHRVSTGRGPDGIAFDPNAHVVAVSAQGAGAVTLFLDDGDGARTDIPVGSDTGNVVFDAARKHFFATATSPDQVVEIDPSTRKVLDSFAVPGCSGAHGLRIHPDGSSALVACEVSANLVRIDLAAPHASTSAGTGLGPDVLAIDEGFGLLYVAAESGDLDVFDIARAGLAVVDSEHPGDNAHSVAIDPATHRAFFPLPDGGKGKPVLRILLP